MRIGFNMAKSVSKKRSAMSLKRSILASAIMLFTLVCLILIRQSGEVQPMRSLSTFPLRIGDWVGEEKYFDQYIYDKLGVDDSILRDYRTRDGSVIELYIGYYQSQSQSDIIHSPKHCMPGNGWKIIETDKVFVHIDDIDAAQKNIRLNHMWLCKGRRKMNMIYWFQGRGRYITSEYMQKIYLVLDSITRRRTDEAFIRIISMTTAGKETKSSKNLIDFAMLLMPILKEYIPS